MRISNRHHREIAKAIRAHANEADLRWSQSGNGYIGTSKPYLPMTVGVLRHLAREWIRRHPNLGPTDYRALLNSLARADTHNEFSFIGELLGFLPKLRRTLDPRQVAGWLERAEGWGEIDTISYSRFTAEEMLSDWKSWKRQLTALCRSRHLSQRRASLVLLTRPVRESPDERLSRVALANIDRLKHERDILITKAISWLLRSLIRQHREEVEAYLRANEAALPTVALRETANKLRTGRKSEG